MKFPILLSLPLLVFGFELNFSKEFSKSILPTELSSTIKVVVENQEEKEVISSLNQYNKFLTKYDKINKSDISMAITPKYIYKDGQSIFMGYNGVLNATVSSTKSSKIKEFLEEFYSQKEENNVSLLMPALQWRINDKVYEEELDQLRFDAILWAKSYSNELSKKLNNKCHVKNITLNGNSRTPMMYASEVKMLNTRSKIEMPITEKVNETITIQPHFTLECQ